MVEPTDPVNEPVVSLLAVGVGPPVRSMMPLFTKLPLTVGVPNTLTRPALRTPPVTNWLVADTVLVPKLMIPLVSLVRLPIQLDPLVSVTTPVLLSRLPVQVPELPMKPELFTSAL